MIYRSIDLFFLFQFKLSIFSLKENNRSKQKKGNIFFLFPLVFGARFIEKKKTKKLCVCMFGPFV